MERMFASFLVSINAARSACGTRRLSRSHFGKFNTTPVNKYFNLPKRDFIFPRGIAFELVNVTAR